MPTPFCEETLDEYNNPSLVGKYVAEQFHAAKPACPSKVKSGPNKGDGCSGTLIFDLREQACYCSTSKRHRWEAHENTGGDLIRKLLQEIPEDKKRELYAAQEEVSKIEDEKARIKAEEVQRANGLKRAMTNAENESEILGVPAGEYHVRPDGPAPESGVTWPYRLGEWVASERLTKKQRS